MEIPFDLLKIVALFLVKPIMKLLNWIDIEKLDWALLCENPNAMTMIEANPHKLEPDCLYFLSKNPNAVAFLEKHPDKINWNGLSKNHNAIHLIEKHINSTETEDPHNTIDWKDLSANPNATHILVDNFDKINWSGLSLNNNIMQILQLLEQKMDKTNELIMKIDWSMLSFNSCEGAIKLLENKIEQDHINNNESSVNWQCLSQNEGAIQLLEKHIDLIDWKYLSFNPKAIHLLEPVAFELDEDFLDLLEAMPELGKQYLEDNCMDIYKIDWLWLSSNSNAIHLLEKVLDFTDPNAIHLLEKVFNSTETNNYNNPHMRINWSFLSENPNLLKSNKILEKHIDVIDMHNLSKNPSIFEIDIEQLNKAIVKKANNIDI
jgi:hypothetical protein